MSHMRSRLVFLAVFAVFAACSDATTTPTAPLEARRNALLGVTLDQYIQDQIELLLPKGFEDAVDARWATVQRKKMDGDMVTAVKTFNLLASWIDKKTAEITPPADETKTQAAARLVLNMANWLYGDGTQVPTLTGQDATVEFVPAGQPLNLETPTGFAGVNWPTGTTVEDRVILVVQNEDKFPGHCNGPLNTRRCQYPLFYSFHSFPNTTKLRNAARFAVCMVAGHEEFRRPLDPDHDGDDVGHEEGPVHARMQLAHDLPASSANYTPGAKQEDGIEILPRSALQSGNVTCDEASHDDTNLSPVARAMHKIMHFAGRVLTPKTLYAFDVGPEHDGFFFSHFNPVDVHASPDLAVKSFTGPSTGNVGEQISVNLVAENKSARFGGSATARSFPANARFFFSSDAVLDSEDDEVVFDDDEGEGEGEDPADVAALAPDQESAAITRSIMLPAEPGEIYLLVKLEQATGSLPECDPPDGEFQFCRLSNNVAALQLAVTSPEVPLVVNATFQGALTAVGMVSEGVLPLSVRSGSPGPYDWYIEVDGQPRENNAGFGSVNERDNDAAADYTAPSEVGSGAYRICAARNVTPTNNACVAITFYDRPATRTQEEQTLVDGVSQLVSAIGGTSQQKLAQVVHSSLSGWLTRLAFPVSCANGVLRMEIQGLLEGVPNGVVLASHAVAAAFLPAVGDDGFRAFDLRTPLRLTEGQQFAVVLSNATGACSIPVTPVGDTYLPADAYFMADQMTDWNANSVGTGRRDLTFKTFVDLSLDQVNDPDDGVASHCADPAMSMFQGLTRTASTLSAVDLRLSKSVSFPTGGLTTTIRIRDGTPTSQVLGQASAVVGPSSPTQGLVRFTFSPALQLTGDSQLVIEWLGPGAEQASGLLWIGSAVDRYSGGTAYGCNGVATPDRDLNFRTYR